MEWYRSATELWISSLRALEQRSTAFLFMHSLLVGAFAVLFVGFQSDIDIKLFIPVLGVTILGLTSSLLFCFFHRITSKDAAYWRAYMRFLEEENTNTAASNDNRPWSLYYKYAEKTETDKIWNYGGAVKRLPAPLLWLGTPVLFATAWTCALVWIIQLYVLGSDEICFWLWVVFGFVCVVAGITTTFVWAKTIDDTYEKLKKLSKSHSG